MLDPVRSLEATLYLFVAYATFGGGGFACVQGVRALWLARRLHGLRARVLGWLGLNLCEPLLTALPLAGALLLLLHTPSPALVLLAWVLLALPLVVLVLLAVCALWLPFLPERAEDLRTLLVLSVLTLACALLLPSYAFTPLALVLLATLLPLLVLVLPGHALWLPPSPERQMALVTLLFGLLRGGVVVGTICFPVSGGLLVLLMGLIWCSALWGEREIRRVRRTLPPDSGHPVLARQPQTQPRRTGFARSSPDAA